MVGACWRVVKRQQNEGKMINFKYIAEQIRKIDKAISEQPKMSLEEMLKQMKNQMKIIPLRRKQRPPVKTVRQPIRTLEEIFRRDECPPDVQRDIDTLIKESKRGDKNGNIRAALNVLRDREKPQS